MFNYLNRFKSFFSLIFVCFLSILFTGCFSKNEPKIAKEEFPSWYLNPISKDNLHLYGIGEGENLDEATKNALISISSNLMISINSTSTLKKESVLKYREYVSKEYRENIESKTENLSFQNYEIINTFKQRYDRFLVNVKVKKTDLLRNLKNELRNLNDNLRVTQNLNQDDLTKYLNYENLYFNFNAFENKIQIINSLDTTFDDEVFYKKLSTLKSDLEELKQKISFTIYQKNSDNFLVSKVKKAISQYGFSIKNDAKYQIHLNSNFNFKDARGMFIANNQLNIDVVFENKIIKSNKYELTGYSSNNIDDAIFNSYEEFTVEIF